MSGFGRLLAAEWTKLATVRGWVIGLLVAAVLLPVVGLLGGGSAHLACGPPGGPVRTGRACLPDIPTGPGGEPVSDSFFFVRRALRGAGSITVAVTALTGRYASAGGGPGGPADWTPGVQPWSKAGLIIAASTRPGAAYAAIMVTGGHGVRFQDDYTGDTAGSPGPAPRWLRLTRAGDTVTGYASADGRHWARVGQATLAGLPGQVPGGLFATSPAHTVTSQFAGGTNSRSGPSLATAAFARIGLRGGWAPGAWTGAAVDPGGAPVRGEWHQAGGTMLVTGAGDIAPAVFGPGLGYPSTSLEGTLTGAFVALIAVLVVAALFITGEYRRGLIKVTLAATPRRGRVLAAKAVVIAAAAGVAGLAGAVIAAVFGPALGRAAGLYVIPVSALTWARAVGGTAALLAVAAVLALAVGTLTRRGAVAVTTLILIVVLPYILAQASLLPVAAGQWLLRVTPAAGFAIQQTLGQYAQVSSSYTPANGFFPLAPWAGFAVLCGWAALALVLAAVALRRRDA